MKSFKFILTTAAIISILPVYKSAKACEEGYIVGVKSKNCIPASGNCGTGCTYTLDEKGNLHLKGTGNTAIGSHLLWTAIPYEADIINVNIGKGITSVGFRAFSLEWGVKNITLSEDMKTIADAAFHATGIKKLVIPASVTSVTSGALGTTSAVLYCTSNQIENCGSNAVLYEKKNDLYYVYDEDGKVSEIFGGYDNFNANVVKTPSERDGYKINEDGTVAILSKDGVLTAKYGKDGNLLNSYMYGENGAVYTFDKNGKLMGISQKGIFSLKDAALVVHNSNDNIVSITW